MSSNTRKKGGQGERARRHTELETLLSEVSDQVKALRKELKKSKENERPEDGPLLTREEASDFLRVSTRTLDDMAAAGEIQPVHIRGRVLYHRETLEAFIRRCSREGGR